MARASIPYDELQIAAEKLFPAPVFTSVRVEGRRRRYNTYDFKPTPTTIYDRRSGNYKSIGYRCYIVMFMFTGFSSRFDPQSKKIEGWFLIELD
tara:strand:- start:400 stop:681 length:282 start_codon:yes stop_codon:yes gene_type:complete